MKRIMKICYYENMEVRKQLPIYSCCELYISWFNIFQKWKQQLKTIIIDLQKIFLFSWNNFWIYYILHLFIWYLFFRNLVITLTIMIWSTASIYNLVIDLSNFCLCFYTRIFTRIVFTHFYYIIFLVKWLNVMYFFS